MPSPLKTMLADKYLVREWIREKLGSEYLVPLIGVYDSFDEIDFDSLPSQFVIKCNHDSGSVTLVTDKSKLDMKALKLKYDFLVRRNYAYSGFEMHYRDIKPKIIIEKFMGNSINDYKFMCFDGRPAYVQVDFNRFTEHHTRNFYDMNWNLQPFISNFTPQDNQEHKSPGEFLYMIDIAGRLSEGFDQVRVDLYLVDGHIYFGEMTFTDGNGFCQHISRDVGFMVGALWNFDNSIRPAILAKYSSPSEK